MVNELVGLDLLAGLKQVQQTGTAKAEKLAEPSSVRGFDSFLREAEEGAQRLRFSAHALKRLEARGIELSQDDLSCLSNAVGQAQAKGSRESLVLMDDLAAIVSVRNRTVVTVLDASNRAENIFTNIDSTVLVRR
ncbi:MAG: hypothetical protein JW759_08610 [Candidatus Coatesbacteria bacterium]|nr:hypothetical protein [Candidatus Coatesbacteria bacterium]